MIRRLEKPCTKYEYHCSSAVPIQLESAYIKTLHNDHVDITKSSDTAAFVSHEHQDPRHKGTKWAMYEYGSEWGVDEELQRGATT